MDDDFHSLKAKRDYPSPAGIGGESYPTLRLNGEQAEECGADECEHGEEYEMTIRVRCKSIGAEYGDSKKPAVTFDIIGCTDCEECDEDDEDEEEEDKGDGDEAKEEKPQSKPRDNASRTIIVGL